MEVVSGEDEALFGYAGAMRELRPTSGAFLDIGGASTEIVTFDEGKPHDFTSFPIGSLSLYHRCVKKILPGKGSLSRLRQDISKNNRRQQRRADAASAAYRCRRNGARDTQTGTALLQETR